MNIPITLTGAGGEPIIVFTNDITYCIGDQKTVDNSTATIIRFTGSDFHCVVKETPEQIKTLYDTEVKNFVEGT